MANETELLRFQVKTLEKNLLGICKNMNTRLDTLENDVDELQRELKICRQDLRKDN